jgi:hypothetical protein
MQTTTQNTKQTAPPSLLQSLLPYLLAIVVLSALPQFVIAEDNSSCIPPAVAYPYVLPMQNGVTPPMLMNMPLAFQAQIWTVLSDEQRRRASRLMTPSQ